MANCKLCGGKIETGVVLHRKCLDEHIEKMGNLLCDDYCKFRDTAKTQDELEELCGKCELAKMLMRLELM